MQNGQRQSGWGSLFVADMLLDEKAKEINRMPDKIFFMKNDPPKDCENNVP